MDVVRLDLWIKFEERPDRVVAGLSSDRIEVVSHELHEPGRANCPLEVSSSRSAGKVDGVYRKRHELIIRAICAGVTTDHAVPRSANSRNGLE